MLPWISAPGAAIEAGERYLQDSFRESFIAGNVVALFDCVSVVPSAFEAPWVAQQITAWRRAGTPEARANLRRLYREAAKDGKGQRAEAWNRIRRDLKILAYVTKHRSPKIEAAVQLARDEFKVSRAMTVKIWSGYQPFFDSVIPNWFKTKRAAVAWLQRLVP